MDLEGVTYGIGVPHDHAVFIAIEDFEKSDGMILDVRDMADEHKELAQIFANGLRQIFEDNFTLKQTPRVLTLEGNLDNYTKDWYRTIWWNRDEPMGIHDVIRSPMGMSQEDLEEELRYLYDRELGEETTKRGFKGWDDDEEISDELLKFFDIPGIGTMENETEGIIETYGEIFDEPNEEMDEYIKRPLLGYQRETSIGLKILSYNFRENKSYSLVKPFEPFTVVGRFDKKNQDEDELVPVFSLLPKEEEDAVVDKLQKLAGDELENLGLKLENVQPGTVKDFKIGPDTNYAGLRP
eukprot:CAMPEP_0116841454 /NCGR_PEP_ID=MMETSP0418-20121206/10932_1 /TAXON_ID=1158023 /ORGANISM="Astrosyne radiata, Strain 13vi08-1A" /LENGTH=295 /DNA_ID=CAMNT_0004471879 /DNA_START=26 /DNA_END=913 /DNA_ORIENTATION=+